MRGHSARAPNRGAASLSYNPLIDEAYSFDSLRGGDIRIPRISPGAGYAHQSYGETNRRCDFGTAHGGHAQEARRLWNTIRTFGAGRSRAWYWRGEAMDIR